jgi:hypothetical protein
MEYVFIRYGYNSSVYFFLHKLNFKDIHPNAIIESKNTIFLKDVFSFEKAQEDYSFNRTIEAGSYSYHHLKDDEVDPKRSKRENTTKIFGHDFLTYLLGNEPWNSQR